MLARWLRHLTTTHFAMGRAFTPETRAAIDEAIAASERLHRAEIRVALETALPVGHLWRGVSARDRAAELFATLQVYDTAENNGILLYVLLAEHDIEIVADRGFRGRVEASDWTQICGELEAAFRQGEYRVGMLAAISRVTALAVAHYPAGADNPDELPNRTLIL
jgi:uncharacterized membrane protein